MYDQLLGQLDDFRAKMTADAMGQAVHIGHQQAIQPLPELSVNTVAEVHEIPVANHVAQPGLQLQHSESVRSSLQTAHMNILLRTYRGGP